MCHMLICFMSFFSLPSLPPFPIHFSLYLSHPLSPSLLSSPSLSLLLPLYFQYNQCLSWRCFKVCQHSLTLWSWQELSHTGGLWATNKSQYTDTHTCVYIYITTATCTRHHLILYTYMWTSCMDIKYYMLIALCVTLVITFICRGWGMCHRFSHTVTSPHII